MAVRAHFVSFFMLGWSVGAEASSYHESLWPGVTCSSEHNTALVRILESPDPEGVFKTTRGLCQAVPSPSAEKETLFTVGHCVQDDDRIFIFRFGGWLNMLTVRFSDQDENQDLFCR